VGTRHSRDDGRVSDRDAELAGKWLKQMVEDGFDTRTFANMNVALDRVCRRWPDGEQHRFRKLVAERIIRCARSGKKTLGALTEAGERVLAQLPEPSGPG
jgi:hypothetical protein